MEDLQRLYPIGIQTFSEIREGNFLYIDKTEYVYRMTHASKYMFLSRPRRFGKSLLVSTLHSYFSGREDLFHGLAMEKLEKEWTVYPVLHFDMSTAKHVDKEQLLQELNLKLFNYEKLYGKEEEEVNPNQRLMELKLDKSAAVAMEQINLKNYPERFALCGLPVVKVAVNFDSESGTLGDWEIGG